MLKHQDQFAFGRVSTLAEWRAGRRLWQPEGTGVMEAAMRFPRFFGSMGLACLATASFAACAGDDDGGPRPQQSQTTATSVAATPATAASPASTATLPAPTATTAPAVNQPATSRDPRFYIYETSAGDTLSSVVAVVNGQPGSAKAGLPDQIRDLNKLTSDTLSPGRALVVPLIVGSDPAVAPDAGINAAIAAGGKGGALRVLEPGAALRDSYKGRLALGTLKVNDGNPASEGYGYLMRYALADRPVLKGGVRDPDAVIVDDAFTVAGGSLVPELRSRAQTAGAPTSAFTRDGVDYLVAAGKGAALTPAAIAGMLEAVSP
jgi:hypothetical protein